MRRCLRWLRSHDVDINFRKRLSVIITPELNKLSTTFLQELRSECWHLKLNVMLKTPYFPGLAVHLYLISMFWRRSIAEKFAVSLLKLVSGTCVVSDDGLQICTGVRSIEVLMSQAVKKTTEKGTQEVKRRENERHVMKAGWVDGKAIERNVEEIGCKGAGKW